MTADTNPYKGQFNSLAAVGKLSILAEHSVDILQKLMVTDPAHDEHHILRVMRNAMWFAEGCDLDVLIPACVLHDLVNVPKDSEHRSLASFWSAEKAVIELKATGWLTDEALASRIHHAIVAHSWSAKVAPETIEAKALQDADRLDSLGYIGIARLFATGGSMGRTLFHPADPIALRRPLDEQQYTLDHHFVKLTAIPDKMQTERGQEEAYRLLGKMQHFIGGLIEELN